jgi:hypothetical protein
LAIASAALVTLIFTGRTVGETNQQLKIAEQGQVTDRYNAAITNLGSHSEDVRLGGIYALQRLMQDSPRDQPTVIAVLCAYVRDHSAEITARSTVEPTDIQAALTVVETRDPAHDGDTTVVDLRGANLSLADLVPLREERSGAVIMRNVDLADANLTGATLRGNLVGANLSGADLSCAHLRGANLTSADLTGATLDQADLTGAILDHADLSGATLWHAHLRGAHLRGATTGGGAFLSGRGSSVLTSLHRGHRARPVLAIASGQQARSLT